MFPTDILWRTPEEIADWSGVPHYVTHEQRAAGRTALPSLEVAVRRPSADLVIRQPVGVHPQAHRATGAAPSKPAAVNTSCSPRASASRAIAFDPGTTCALVRRHSMAAHASGSTTKRRPGRSTTCSRRRPNRRTMSRRKSIGTSSRRDRRRVHARLLEIRKAREDAQMKMGAKFRHQGLPRSRARGRCRAVDVCAGRSRSARRGGRRDVKRRHHRKRRYPAPRRSNATRSAPTMSARIDWAEATSQASFSPIRRAARRSRGAHRCA